MCFLNLVTFIFTGLSSRTWITICNVLLGAVLLAFGLKVRVVRRRFDSYRTGELLLLVSYLTGELLLLVSGLLPDW